MMKTLVLFTAVLTLLLYSCGGSEKKESVGPVEEFGRGKESATAEEEVVENKEEESDSLIVDTTNLAGKKLYRLKNMFATYDTVPAKETTLFDRFTTTSSVKFKFRKKSTVPYGEHKVFPELELYYYQFQDSVAAHNAIFNWLDCLGDCQQVSIGQEFEAFKSAPFRASFSKNEVLLVKLKCEHQSNDWSAFLNEVDRVLEQKPYATINVSCGGPLKWNLSDAYQEQLKADRESQAEDE